MGAGLKTVLKPKEHDRVNAVLDILKGMASAEGVRKKYDIAFINSVYAWIGKYVGQEKNHYLWGNKPMKI